MTYFCSYSGFWARWLAAFALLLQALMPLAQAVQVQNEDGEFSSLIICTAYGLQQISIGSDSEPSDGAASSESCPICLAQSIGAKLLTSADMVELSGSAFVRIRMAPPLRIASETKSDRTLQSARAPPLFA